MWVESCSIPENTLNGLQIELPSEIREWVISETREHLIDCFIESLEISSPMIAFENIFRQRMQNHLRNSNNLVEWLNIDIIQDIVYHSVQEFYRNHMRGMRLDPQVSYIVVNWVVMNFSNISDDNIYPVRPESRPENLRNNLFWNLEWDQWFQSDTNWGMTLSQAYEQYGFPEDLQRWLWLLFQTYFWDIYELPSWYDTQINKLVRFVIGIESFGWYNIVLNDRVRTSWYYQFQVEDWDYWREVYNFSTRRFENWWRWRETDREVRTESEWIRRIYRLWSYEQALNSIPENIIWEFPWLEEQIRHVWNNTQRWNIERLDPASLSSTEQTLLFITNLYSKGGWSSQELFRRILHWDDEAIIELYRTIHHWDRSRRDTLRVVQRVASEVLWIQYNW